MRARNQLDVYRLPSSGLDAQHPIWWGNTLLLAVETTIVALLLVTYFYVRKNFEPWPPPIANASPLPTNRLPDLVFSTINVLVLLGSCVPMMALDRLARRRSLAEQATEEMPREPLPKHGGYPPGRLTTPIRWLILLTTLGVASATLRFLEFPGLRFVWHDNAYASVIWSLLGLHLSYIGMSVVEVTLLLIWIWREGFSNKFALDATLAATSWYWTAAVGLVIYVVVYWTPRWMSG